jgi:anti-sigma-K factor RskA
MSTSEHSDAGGRDEDFLAADYVLGLLDAADRRRAEARLAADPAFAAEVAALEATLAPLADEVAEVAPSPALWPRIAAALAPDGAPAGRARLWDNLGFWRALSFAAGGLAAASLAAVGVLVWLAVSPAPRQPMPLVASLAESSGPGHIMVTVDRSRGMIMVMPAAMPATGSQVPQLWVIPPGGTPRSLGMVDAEKPMTMKVPPELMAALTPRAMLALSMEPPGGSPTGQPTGPVVASGHLAVL